MLPVVVTATVDLSRVDTSIVAHITSFLGESCELLSLALTCKSFGRPASTLKLSLVEEVARQGVCSRATGAEMSCLPQYASGTTTWLSILNRFEHLLVFDVLLGRYIEHQNGDLTAVCGIDADGADDEDIDITTSTAVASGFVMTSGVHYAEFKITGFACIGIVRPMPGLDAGSYDEFSFIHERSLYPDFFAQRSDDWGSIHACEYNACVTSGKLSWTDWEASTGDPYVDIMTSIDGTIPMLLNLDKGTLTAYGLVETMVMDGLSGPYCWYASVDGWSSNAVAIRRGTPPSQMGNVV